MSCCATPLLLVALVGAGCSRYAPAARPAAVTAALPAQPEGGKPADPWERRVGRSYENRGIAKIEQLGGRWALTIECSGTHSIYIDESSGPISPGLLNQPVRVRYRYIERAIDNPRCGILPCASVRQKLAVIEHVQRVVAADPTAEGCGEPRQIER
jgi:hypothetical protein